MVTEQHTLDVNGVERIVECDPETPLLYVLRNDIGLKGTKFGCGLGLCGACNVLLDGRAVHSCDTPVWAAVGKAITTVEGIGTSESPHPVQTALLDLQAAQCGYCIPGIVVSATELLEQNAAPTEDEVRQALDKNLCRCGSHKRILCAVMQAAQQA